MKINNLTKRFGSKAVFENASIEFEENKINYILGESGSGKTTLLRIISGLDKSFKGEISPQYTKISCVFQEPRLFPNLTVAENIKITAESSPYTVDDLLKILELEGEADALPASLSGGMKMRVSLARALYYNGDLFIMDEPFGALNDELRQRILPEIFKCLEGKTVIIVSHNVEEAKSYASNILNLDLVNNSLSSK